MTEVVDTAGHVNDRCSTVQMQRQPDCQRDHHYGERIAAKHYAGHFFRLALILLTEHIIQHRRGQRHRQHQQGVARREK